MRKCSQVFIILNSESHEVVTCFELALFEVILLYCCSVFVVLVVLSMVFSSIIVLSYICRYIYMQNTVIGSSNKQGKILNVNSFMFINDILQ
jgi:hypothetical protein